MKKYTFLLFIIVLITLTCSGNKIEKSADDNAASKTNSSENLIITNEKLDFSKHKVTFIELGADRCIPCKAMQPVMREIAQEYKGKIQVVFYDVWKTPQYAKDYRVQLIPTQVFIDKSGHEISRHVGFYAKDEIIMMLTEKGIL